ncbi:sulfite exporter TauE/SafE family protein [Roseomonas xinghualingensis]|uniref:sulfite exporter TauE/SafE family protein n=1 Tax=Roseomonas xinghualingensis TaxID=2986475 RepID=UPI0021F10AA3|nr:sulfite exporter TauE/SafE family protein [Roseomonas sp. SXEYE001]MCV4209841.1 sulfite exporter TauE/SafE family protein [Roseomonas sp. SXEYE001]
MDDLLLGIIIFAVVGLVSGFVAGLFSIGGGTIRMPIFIYLLPWLGVANPVMMHVATGTSMALIIPSAIASSRKHYKLGNLDLGLFKTWAIGLLIGVAIGSILLPFGSPEILQALFSIYIILAGFYIAFGHGRFSFGQEPPRGAKMVGISSVVGVIAVMTGTAGGTLTTPILSAFNMHLDRAMAISAATGLITGTVGAIGSIIGGWNAKDLPSYSLGYVDILIFLVMMPTIMIAAPIGVRVSHKMNERTLQLTYAILLIVVGIDLL